MDGWVLERTARLLMAHLPGSTLGEHVDTSADVNVFFPYYRLQEPYPTLTAGLYTHFEAETPKAAYWQRSIAVADWCFGMSEKTLALLPAAKSSLLPLPADPALTLGRKVRFGACGRDYQSGRKNMDWVTQLSTLPGTEWTFTGGDVPQDQMRGFYDSIDYLVVLSDNEGGPLPLKEAIACGKPVITPNVGWAWDYPVIRYEGFEGLRKIICDLTPKDETQPAARALYSACWRLKHKEAA